MCSGVYHANPHVNSNAGDCFSSSRPFVFLCSVTRLFFFFNHSLHCDSNKRTSRGTKSTPKGKKGGRGEDRGVQDGELSSVSSLCCYDSRLCWHALELALPSPLASGHPWECVCSLCVISFCTALPRLKKRKTCCVLRGHLGCFSKERNYKCICLH